MKKMGLLLTVVLVLAFTISMTAKAASFKENRREVSDKQYRVMEEEFLSAARMILLEKGCKNAGVTLTYVTDMDGNREYTVCVHHEKLSIMEADEYGILQARIMQSVKDILFAESILKKIYFK